MSEAEPAPWRGHATVPDRVDHTLDLDSWRYQAVATWYHFELTRSRTAARLKNRRPAVARWPVPTAWEMLWFEQGWGAEHG